MQFFLLIGHLESFPKIRSQGHHQNKLNNNVLDLTKQQFIAPEIIEVILKERRTHVANVSN